MESIASITTAFNAAHILPRQIDALLAQSRPLQEIIVVDNASTDGTSAMLEERYPQVTVLRLERNTGASGGCAAGLKYAALEKKHDWIWNFDGDSVPAEDALQIMLSSWAELSENSTVGVLAPLPVHEETGVYYLPLLWRDGLIKPSKEVLAQPVWFADVVVASGCLVRRDVVETVGLPREDFFMDYFDFEYCLRIRKRGYRDRGCEWLSASCMSWATRIVRLSLADIVTLGEAFLHGGSIIWTRNSPIRFPCIQRQRRNDSSFSICRLQGISFRHRTMPRSKKCPLWTEARRPANSLASQ